MAEDSACTGVLYRPVCEVEDNLASTEIIPHAERQQVLAAFQLWTRRSITDIHLAAHALHPKNFGVELSVELKDGLYRVFEHFHPDPRENTELHREFVGAPDKLERRQHLQRPGTKPHLWWNLVGGSHRHLTHVAARLLSKRCSTSNRVLTCSHTLSIQSKLCAGLPINRALVLVYIIASSHFIDALEVVNAFREDDEPVDWLALPSTELCSIARRFAYPILLLYMKGIPST